MPYASNCRASTAWQTRQKVKRQLLDQLDTMHKFELPPRMVDQEFDNIWRQVTAELAQGGRTFETEGTTEEAAGATTARSPSAASGSVW